MARGSANNVVESKTRAKKGVPIKEKDSKKAPTAVEKAASVRKAEKTAPAKKNATKTSSEVKTNTVAEDDEEKKKTGTTAIKAGSKKNEKEVSKKIKKVEVSTTKSEKTGRKRKIEEADEAVNDKPNENESGEKIDDKQPTKKRTKTNLSSNVAENLPTKVTKKSEKVTNVKIPVRKARNPKKGVVESELNDEGMDLQREDETKSKKSKAELTQDTNLKKTSVASKSSSKTSEKESNIQKITEKGKKVQTVSQKMKNAKKNAMNANDKDKTLMMESSDEDESETSESCEVEVPAKGIKKSTESKAVTKGKKNSNLENSVRKTRNTKKPPEQNLPKISEVENQIKEEENTDIIAEADQPKKYKKVEISGRKTRNAKKTEEAITDMESEKLDQNIEQVETNNEKDQVLDVGKTRNFKRGGNKKSDAASATSKASENSVSENKADTDDSHSKTENNEVTEKKTKQKMLKKKDESDATVSTRKLKRGVKVVSEEESTEKMQISADEENSNSNSSDTAKVAPIRKTRRGGKAVAEEESTQISTEIKDLDEENSNSNLSNMADSAKTAPTRKTRRGVKTVPDEKSTDQMLISAEIKDLDEENSNSNLSNTADSAKTALTRKTRRGIKNVPDDKSTNQMQIPEEVKDVDEENSNSNLSNTEDSAKAAPTRKTRRGVKTVSDKESTEQMQISAEIKNLDEGNKNSNNLSNVADSIAAVPTRKTRRGVKAVSGEETSEEKQISTEAKDNTNSNSVSSINKTSIESTVTGRTRSGSLSKQKCDQLAMGKKLRSKLQSDMKESIDNKEADENAVHNSEKASTQKLQVSAETKDLDKDDNSSNDLSNFSTSTSNRKVRREIKTVPEENSTKQMSEQNSAGSNSSSSKLQDGTSASGDSETVEINQSSVNDPKSVKKERISKKSKTVNVQVNKNLDEEICANNNSEVIENLSGKRNVFSDINSESVAENDPKENQDFKVSTEVSVVISKEIKNTIGDEKNEPTEVEHRDCNENEIFAEMAAEKVLEQTEMEEQSIETETSSNGTQGLEHENMISDVNLDQTEILEQQKGKEMEKSEEVVNMKTVETNIPVSEVSKQCGNAERKYSEIFNEKDPEEHLEINKLNTKVSKDGINVEASQASKSDCEVKISDSISTSKDAFQITVTEENMNKSSQKDSVTTSVNVENKSHASSTEVDIRNQNKEISLVCFRTSDGENKTFERSESNKDMEANEEYSKELNESENFQNVNTKNIEISDLEKEISRDMNEAQNSDKFLSKESFDLPTRDTDRNEELQGNEMCVGDKTQDFENMDYDSNSECLEIKGSPLFTRHEVDLSINDTEFENDENVYLDEKNSNETNSKDSYLNENEDSGEELLIDDEVKHSTKSLPGSSELLKEISAVNEKDLFHSSDGSSSQLRGKDIDTSQEQEETPADQHQQGETSNDIEKQEKSLDADEQSEEISVESKQLKETCDDVRQLKETCVDDGELLKEISFNDKQLKENSVLVCEQMTEISVKSDEGHNETYVSNQYGATFVDNNKEQFPDDNDQDHTKKFNEMSPVADDDLDKTSVGDAEQLNEMSIDDYEQLNTSVDAEEHMPHHHKTCADNNAQLNRITVSKDTHLNENFADSSQQLDNILVVDDSKEISEGMVDDLEFEETYVESGSAKEEVIDSAVQLNEELGGNQKLNDEMVNEQSDEVGINDGELMNESLVVTDEQISVCEEQMNKELSDNSILNELSIDGMQVNETLADDNNKQLNESSVDGKQLNDALAASSEKLKDLCSSADNSVQLNEASADNDEQLNEASTVDCQQLNEVSVVNKELLETSADCGEQLNEASIGDNEHLRELPVFDSGQLGMSSFGENEQLNEALSDVDKQLNETSVINGIQVCEASADGDVLLNDLSAGDGVQLKGSSIGDCLQLKESSNSESVQLTEPSSSESVTLKVSSYGEGVQLKEASSGDVVQLKDLSTSDSVQLKELSTNDGVHLNNQLGGDGVHLKEPSTSDGVHLKEQSTSDGVQLKEPPTSDSLQLKEISTCDDMQLNKTTADDSVQLNETSVDDSVKLNEASIDNSILLNETSVESVICSELGVTTLDNEQLKKSSEKCDNQLAETFNSGNEQLNETNSSKFLHTKADQASEKMCHKNTEHDLNLGDTTGFVSYKIADDTDRSKDSSVIQITEQTDANDEFSLSNQPDHKNVGKEFVCNQSSVTTSEYYESVKMGEDNNACEENASDESSLSVMSPKNLIICEEHNMEEENKLASSYKNDKDIENVEIAEKKDTDGILKFSSESTSCDRDILKGETNKETFSTENRTDLSKMPDSINKSSVEALGKVSHNRESSLSTYTKRVDSGTISIVKKDGNRKKTKLIKTTGNSKQISDEELKRLSANLEQSRSSDIVSRKSVKRKSENPENSSSKSGLDSSTEISVAIKIKKKKMEEEESMSEVDEKMMRSLLSTDVPSSSELESQDSHCRLDPSEPGPSRVETEAELNSRKRKATSSSSSLTSNEAKKSKIKNSSIPVRMYLEQFVPFLLEGLLKITYVRPDDPIQYLADWMKDNKVAAYRRMNS
ncbi:hypothetical protein AVEN_201508-1 [Araneus ventricosus]|uniref:Uncharacterized protein n=1 Tax=Araneus ventricosus TaxID=182803 RepID=A0A4Y2QIF0_ARAVE|nr:hypothetical protein AVEN_174197-1 [Araneus ventricosus]GBN63128.1 hypothetical protein AVEN_201508-1 [Araneus ventricosus]